MVYRAQPSGIRLSAADAAIATGMLARGDQQHDVAAWFGVNGGRIAEIASGHAFGWVIPKTTELPPPGPYPAMRKVYEAQSALDKALDALAAAEHAIVKLKEARNPARDIPARQASGLPGLHWRSEESALSRISVGNSRGLGYLTRYGVCWRSASPPPIGNSSAAI